jgi:AcrR family transcriptional regulator
LGLLKEVGLPGFSIEGVAARANVAKGLVLYHYGSRAKLLRLCAERLEHDRAERLAAAPAGHLGVAAVDAVWNELVRQHEDGTARAWLSLAAGGVLVAPTAEADVLAQSARTLIDGCAAALAAGVERGALREAYDALSLALLDLREPNDDASGGRAARSGPAPHA